MTTTTENQTTQAQWNAANRFLDRLLIDQTLTNSYLEISQQANGQDNAPEILTTWLQEQGYDTTPDLVYDALIALQNTSLTYWSGIYGQSFFEGSRPAPVLAIGPNTEGNTVPYLNGIELKNYVFESVETDNAFHPVLSWNLEHNQTAGKITFYYTSAVTLGSTLPTGYTGNWFQGTLQTSASSSAQNYHGAIGESTDKNAIPTLNLAISGDIQDWWSNYSTYVYIAIGVVAVAVIIGTLIYRNQRVDNANFENVNHKESIEEEELKRQIREKNRIETPQPLREWIEEVWQEKGMTDDSQRLAFEKIINKAETHFGNQAITKAQLLKFISDEEKNALDLSKGQYVDEGLDRLISKATGIPLEKITPLLTSSGQNELMSNQDWLKLIEEGETNQYFDHPQVNDQNYQAWLQKVKDQLKEASKGVQPDLIQEQLPTLQVDKAQLVADKKAEIKDILSHEKYTVKETVDAELKIRQLLREIVKIDPAQTQFKSFLEEKTYSTYRLSAEDKALLSRLTEGQEFSAKQWKKEFDERSDAYQLRLDWNKRSQEKKANQKGAENGEQMLIQSMLIVIDPQQFNQEQPVPPNDFQKLKENPPYEYKFEEVEPLTQAQKEQNKRRFVELIETEEIDGRKYHSLLKQHFMEKMDGLKPNTPEYNNKLKEINKNLQTKKQEFIEEGRWPFYWHELQTTQDYNRKLFRGQASPDIGQGKQIDVILQKLIQDEDTYNVYLDRYQEYLDNLDKTVQKAKKDNPNMTEEQAQEWLLKQPIVFDPEGNDYTEDFLHKMGYREQSVQVKKPVKPDVKQPTNSKPNGEPTTIFSQKQVISPNQQVTLLDKDVIDKALEPKKTDSKNDDPQKTEKNQKENFNPHEVKTHEGPIK